MGLQITISGAWGFRGDSFLYLSKTGKVPSRDNILRSAVDLRLLLTETVVYTEKFGSLADMIGKSPYFYSNGRTVTERVIKPNDDFFSTSLNCIASDN